VRPQARIREARWLANAGASAAIDISDGLAADLTHVAFASGVAIEVDLTAIPVSPGADARAALSSGEEYELAITAPRAIDAATFVARFGLPLTLIGRVADGEPGLTVRDQASRVTVRSGHDHFSA
jgi:thiamine-monophosphate kinase